MIYIGTGDGLDGRRGTGRSESQDEERWSHVRPIGKNPFQGTRREAGKREKGRQSGPFRGPKGMDGVGCGRETPCGQGLVRT
jgi:hypothetical protein